MDIVCNNRGFSLIELIFVAVIINILAGVAIVAYIGAQEKTKISHVIRTASSASADLRLWLDSSFSAQRSLRELDTDLDGRITSADKTNGELLTEGVAKAYVEARNSKPQKEVSPWFNRLLWNTDAPPPNGTISLTQPSNTLLRIVAKEKNGIIVYKEIISAN